MVERAGAVLLFILIGSVILIHEGTSLYWRGYHSEDLGWNLKTLNMEFGVNMVDIGVNLRTGETGISTDTEMILNGTVKMERGKEMMMIGFLFFGISIGGLARGNDVYKLKHPKKKTRKKSIWSRFRH